MSWAWIFVSITTKERWSNNIIWASFSTLTNFSQSCSVKVFLYGVYFQCDDLKASTFIKRNRCWKWDFLRYNFNVFNLRVSQTICMHMLTTVLSGESIFSKMQFFLFKSTLKSSGVSEFWNKFTRNTIILYFGQLYRGQLQSTFWNSCFDHQTLCLCANGTLEKINIFLFYKNT